MISYKKIILSYILLDSSRMLIGASSTIYMLMANISLYEIGLIKSMQAVIICILGFGVGILSDTFNRKYIHLFAIMCTIFWLGLMYIAGNYQSLTLFFIAELFNALSLCVYQNNSNAYLIEQYKRDEPKWDLNVMLGSFRKFDFLCVAFTSLLGGVLFSYILGDIFLLTTLIAIFIFCFSYYALPNISVNTYRPLSMNKKAFQLVFRKFAIYKFDVILFLIYSLYFQVIIQYWQVIYTQFSDFDNNGFILGIVLFLMFIAQALSGYVIEKKYRISLKLFHSLFLLVAILSLWAIYTNNIIVYSILLITTMFIIRYILTLIDAKIHTDLRSKFRAKYDATLNTLLRILTAILLVVVGYLSEYYGVNMINYIGIFLALFTLSLSIWKK